jgi:hypothetical protein
MTKERERSFMCHLIEIPNVDVFRWPLLPINFVGVEDRTRSRDASELPPTHLVNLASFSLSMSL